jgi:lipopolysaccharide transport system ATP-binding protein
MKPILEVRNLWKQYQIGGQQTSYLSLRERLLQPFQKQQTDTFWALQDINFDVYEGECIGIIGRNGAGKSTLLKILSQITPPTKGYIKARGRVASLLEVGTGFHPELTGRENVYLNGSILGLKRAEINAKFDEIIDFSGVEKFLDTPLKHYSSGMRLRLAFSVAAHLEPEILLIDEVLAVGDAEFQKKCLGKMDEVSKSGRTVIFVSHNLESVQALCSRGILLNKGTIALDETIAKVINHYGSKLDLKSSQEWNVKTAPSQRGITLLSVKTINHEGHLKSKFKTTEDVIIEFSYYLEDTSLAFIHGLNLHNIMGKNVFNAHDVNKDQSSKKKSKHYYTTQCIIPKHLLNVNIYIVSIAFLNPSPFDLFLWVKEAISFEIIEAFDEHSARGQYRGDFPGIIRPLLEFNTKISN